MNKYFDHIYVIYIPAREKYIRQVMKELKINATFVPAKLIEDLPSLNELLKKKLLSPYFFYKHFKYEGYPIDLIKYEKLGEKNEEIRKFIRGLKGKLALHLSYLHIFEMFLKTKGQNCFIFEDDVLIPNKNYLSRMKNIMSKEIPNNEWDYINFGRCFDMCEINTPISENLIIDSYPLCTHSCAYNRRICEELILFSIPLRQAGDHIIKEFFYLNPKYKCYTVVPAMFFQNKSFESTLGNSNNELEECGKSKYKNSF